MATALPKSNHDYWAARQSLDAKITREEKSVNQKLKSYYQGQAAALQKEIASYYAKYGEDNVLKYQQLLLDLDDGDKQLLYQNWDAFAQKYPQYSNMLPVRESIYQLNRLKGLQMSMELQSLEIGAVEVEKVQAHLEKMYEAGRGYAQGVLGSTFNRADTTIAEYAVGNAWYNDGESFSDRIWSNRQALTQTLEKDVLNGIIRGESYKRIAAAIQKKFTDTSRKNIERLIFTEDTYLTNEAAMKQYENDPDFEEYEFMANTGCCAICSALNGQRFKITDRHPGENFPPLHPWCRCTFVPVYKKAEGEGQQ